MLAQTQPVNFKIKIQQLIYLLLNPQSEVQYSSSLHLEITKIIKNLNNNKGAEVDNISSKVLKAIAIYIFEALACINRPTALNLKMLKLFLVYSILESWEPVIDKNKIPNNISCKSNINRKKKKKNN